MQIIYRYLQEIGYTDTIIDVRSNRVRSLLGLNNNAECEENLNNAAVVSTLNGNESSNKRACENQGRRTPAKKVLRLSKLVQFIKRESQMYFYSVVKEIRQNFDQGI